MAVVVNTNVDSITVQRNLNFATSGLSKTMERLTTGLKINHASDDAAGLVITKGIETQQRGSVVAQNNAQVGINLLNTAEGNLSAIQEHLTRIRDLTLQAMNGGYSDKEVKALEDEVVERLAEIDRISNGAKFNNFELFTGTTNDLVLQIGTGADAAGATNPVNTITIKDVFNKATVSYLTGDANAATNLKFLNGTTVKDNATIGLSLDKLDKAITEISTKRGTIGAITNRLNSTIDTLDIQNENLLAAKSRVEDADIGQESSNYTKQQILQQASASLLTQANQAPSIALSLI